MLAHTSLVVCAAYAATFALAQMRPNTPGPGETYLSGSPCFVAWDIDDTQTWKNVTIDLMSGSNQDMKFVTNVASSIDGSDSSKTSYEWTCPEVDPYSAIYFYQFTNGDNTANMTWTTRFAIASPNNETVPPAHAQQPDGSPVPWGTGRLLREGETTQSVSEGKTIVVVDSSGRIETANYYVPSSGSPKSISGGSRSGSIAGILPANASVIKSPGGTTAGNNSDQHGTSSSSTNVPNGVCRTVSAPQSWRVPFTSAFAISVILFSVA